MSKSRQSFLAVLVAALWVLQLTGNSSAQNTSVEIRIDAEDPHLALIQGRFLGAVDRREIRFLTEYGSSAGLAGRIGDVKLLDREGKPLSISRPHPGTYRSDGPISSWSYRANIGPTTERFAAAHLSRSDRSGAILMLDDLLPQFEEGSRSARVALELPPDWTISSAESMSAKNTYQVADTERAVFYASRSIRKRSVTAKGTEINLSITGNWHFTDEEATGMASSIFLSYKEVFGAAPSGPVHIWVGPFPNSVPVGQWEADSRGSSITLISSDMPFRSQSLQRLHEQLRHEIFHLWIPNGVDLSGDYNWFYEGFALYASLKNGVDVNRISFNDMLDTLARAYDIAGAASNVSLIHASKNRWNGSNTQVYARGMLAAFLCDLAMLEASRGKRSVNDLLGNVYKKHRAGPRQNANEAILAILRSYPELRTVVDANITAGEAINWEPLLRSAGLEFYRKDQLARLKATEKPTGRQKEMLNKLGYNNWRKLSEVDR